MKWENMEECDFCSRSEEPENLVEVSVNPRAHLAVDFSDKMREILERRENKEWVFEGREPSWDTDKFPTPDCKSYNTGMVKLSVADMMEIFDEALQMHNDGSIEVCEYCAETFK